MSNQSRFSFRRTCPFGAVAIFIVLCAAAPPLRAQMVGQWQAHTSMRQVQSIAAGGENIWAGTAGGLFSFNPSSGEIARFTTVEGLHAVDVRAVAYDSARQNVWVGYPDGVLQRLEVSSGAMETFRAIARTPRFSDRTVHTLEVLGDSLLVGTAFGLVVFDMQAREVRDSYVRFGASSSSAAVYDVEMSPITVDGDETSGFWLATGRGVASASRAHPNLRDPSAWTVEQLPGGSEEQPVTANAVARFGGAIYVGSSAGGFVRESDGTYTDIWSTSRAVRGFAHTSDYLVGVLPFTLRVRDRQGRTGVVDVGDLSDHRALMVDSEERLWLGDGASGLVSFDQLPFDGDIEEFDHSVVPEGPYHSLFSELVIDEEGTLWAATTGGTGTGFYRLKDGEWTNFIGRFFPELEGYMSFDRIAVVEPGNVWAGSAGDGLVHRASDGTLATYDASNSPLEPAPNSNNYIRVGGVGAGSDGTVWVTNLFGSPPVLAHLPDGTWHGLTGLADRANASSVLFNRIFVDSHGQKWIDVRNTSDAREGEGVMVVDTGPDPTDTSDDRARLIPEGAFNRGLPNRTVTAMTEDLAGRVWIGTEQGLAFFEGPQFVLSATNPSLPQWPVREGRVLLNDVFVQDIAVNPADQKWIATTDGMWLLNSAGTEVLQHLTTENSPLFSNNIVSVAVDPASGEVYFATNQGLQSVVGEAVRTTESPDELHVYPNPVRLNGSAATAAVTIEGLMAEASVRIVTPDGRLVKQLQPSGGRAQWDVTDANGDPVASGMYIVMAAAEDGTAAHGKIAVIR